MQTECRIKLALLWLIFFANQLISISKSRNQRPKMNSDKRLLREVERHYFVKTNRGYFQFHNAIRFAAGNISLRHK